MKDKNWITCIGALIVLLGTGVLSCRPVEAETRCASTRVTEVGALDPDFLSEESGIAVSRRFGNRLYHINDSGDGPFFYLTNFAGAETRAIEIDGFTPKDTEDLTYGPCPIKNRGHDCLFIADVGDNRLQRRSIEILAIEEQETFTEPVQPLAKIVLKYPDRPHNAEAVAIHPNGDLYVLTKEKSQVDDYAAPAQLFKLPASAWKNKRETQVLQHVGQIDLPSILPQDGKYGFYGHLATSMDISQEGRRLIVLTYEYAIEFDIESLLKAEPSYQILKISALEQQESVTYLPFSTSGKSSFLYTTESKKTPGKLIQVDCL